MAFIGSPELSNRLEGLGGLDLSRRSDRINRSIGPGSQISKPHLLAIYILNWVLLVEDLRVFELHLSAPGSKPGIPGPEHKDLMETLIKQGEVVLNGWKSFPNPLPLELTIEDFETTLDGLKQTFIADYQNATDSEVNRSLQEAFGFCEA